MTARHKNRPPTPPGEMLAETLSDMGMTQGQLAEKMGIPIQRVNLIINGHRSISAETAILLARAFGTTPHYWLNAQNDVDLWNAERELGAATP